MANAEVDWDRLDKQKFFVVGVGLFSGVTTALFPLTVIKTRQMAAHTNVPAGLSGTKYVAQQVWKHEGIRGFYRGYTTVLLGTIPGRTIYMSTLELAKSATAKFGEQLNIAPTAVAGISSFVGGAAGSISTQAVVVPIDVISQRLMVQGSALQRDRSSSTRSSNAIGRAAAQATGAAGASQPAAAMAMHTSAGSNSSSACSTSSSTRQAVSCSYATQHQQHASRLYSNYAASTSGKLFAQDRQPAASSGSNNKIVADGSRSSSRITAGWHSQSLLPYGQGATLVGRSMNTAAVPHLSGLQMAQLIIQQEGIGGLWRGFWPSVATFVPNSAIWWGAYGFYQKLIWDQLDKCTAQPTAVSSSSMASSNSSSSNMVGKDDGSSSSSTSVVVPVQVTAGVLSGLTSALLTNPLDLIKTRLQVADAVNGVAPRWSAVLRELMQEEGLRGLLRGVAPRMASSAMWGTAMVSTYEFLKRICALPEAADAS